MAKTLSDSKQQADCREESQDFLKYTPRCCRLGRTEPRFLTLFETADRLGKPVTFHSTTILAVRHRDRAVLAGDGQVTFGQTVVKVSARRKSAVSATTASSAGFAGSAADSFALFARFESKLEQYRGNLERLGGGAGQRLAHRSHPAPSRSDAGRPRQDVDVPAVRATATSSSRTTGSWRSDRAARSRWRPRRRWSNNTDARRPRHCREGDGGSPARSASTRTRNIVVEEL